MSAASVRGLVLLLIAGAACAPLPKPAALPPPTPTPDVGSIMPRWESIAAAAGGGLQAYRITTGDVVDIAVAGHDDMRKELPVRPDGRISYIFVGEVEAAGLTVDELRAAIESDLTRYMRYPQVSVILKKAREAQFAIIGKVVRPGIYPINGPTTIVSAVALAQGLASGQYEGSTIEIADLKNSFLVRRGKVVPVDFERLIHRGDTTQDVQLEDNDYLFIPSSLAQEVYVLGEVFKPRAFGFRGRVTLMQAVAESGGFRPSARLGDVVVLRGQYGNKKVVPVNVKDIVAGRLPDPDLAVGDIVYVPRTRLASLGDAMGNIMPALLALQLGRSF